MNGSFRKTLIALLAGVAMAGFAAGAAQAADPAPATSAAPAATTKASARRMPLTGVPTLAKIRQGGELRVGLALNAPFVMHDKQGRLIGYSVDLARRFADSMGWKLKLVETSWPNLMSGLRSNEYDMIVSGLSITPRRAMGVLFSKPVGEFDVGVVVNRARLPDGGIAALAKLDKARIGVRKGELNVDFARAAFPAPAIVEVDSEGAALADLVSGKLDAYVAEAPLPQVAAEVHADKLRVLGGDSLAHTAHGIAVRLGDGGLLRVVDAWIVFEQASGWLEARNDYWFEGTSWGSEL